MRITDGTIERMTPSERFQHAVLFVSFTVLAITGFLVFLPGRYIAFMGASSESFFEWRGYIHRIAGLVTIVASFYHLFYLFFTERGKWFLGQILPRWHDFTDFGTMVRHFMDPRAPLPKFTWFSYVEKAEYWALIWGTVVMNVTGVLLWFEFLSSKILLDIFTVVHRYEAILAVLSILVWHFYHVHWKPGVFPMNPAWFTGQVSEDYLRHHHPLAYEEVKNQLGKGNDEF